MFPLNTTLIGSTHFLHMVSDSNITVAVQNPTILAGTLGVKCFLRGSNVNKGTLHFFIQIHLYVLLQFEKGRVKFKYATSIGPNT